MFGWLFLEPKKRKIRRVYIQLSKLGLCSQNIDHFNFLEKCLCSVVLTGFTNDPSNATPGHPGGQVGLGAGHLPTYIDLSNVL